jgi:2-polyprenyl-3-methyl-5-hydroxy-6-metoxy-1,4-benzoquinol methylase
MSTATIITITTTKKTPVNLAGHGRECPHQRAPAAPFAPHSRALAMMTFSSEEIQANHARLLERNTTHRRFGYDPEASVRFVIGKALPLRGRVLDIGTGKGRFVVALARHVANLTTVDISAEEQQCARLEAAHAGVADRITFVLADARNLPWPAGSFDAVTSWNVFHHLEDPGRVFAEMLRVLKPTGKLILADFSMSGFRIMDAIHGRKAGGIRILRVDSLTGKPGCTLLDSAPTATRHGIRTCWWLAARPRGYRSYPLSQTQHPYL